MVLLGFVPGNLFLTFRNTRVSNGFYTRWWATVFYSIMHGTVYFTGVEQCEDNLCSIRGGVLIWLI